MHWTNEIYSKHLSTPKIQAALFIYWPMWRYTSRSPSFELESIAFAFKALCEAVADNLSDVWCMF